MCGPCETTQATPILFDENGKPKCYMCGKSHFGETARAPTSVCKGCGELYDTVQLFEPKGGEKRIVYLSDFP